MNQRKLGILLSYLNIALHAVIGFLYVPILLHFICADTSPFYR